MRILFTICGRAGSKGIKNKNTKMFLGYPLPYYTLSAIDLFLIQSNNIECDIVVNTDSQELINLMRDNPMNREVNYIQREEILSGDRVSKIAVIKNCLEEMEQRKNVKYDLIVDLDITSPLRTERDIRTLVEKAVKTDYDVVFSVTNARRNPYFNMVKKEGEVYKRVIDSDFVSRQEAPEIYDMNASLYAYKHDFLYTSKDIFKGKCGIICMMDTGILDLDHENDLELMSVIAKYIFDKYPEYKEIRDNIKLNPVGMKNPAHR